MATPDVIELEKGASRINGQWQGDGNAASDPANKPAGLRNMKVRLLGGPKPAAPDAGHPSAQAASPIQPTEHVALGLRHVNSTRLSITDPSPTHGFVHTYGAKDAAQSAQQVAEHLRGQGYTVDHAMGPRQQHHELTASINGHRHKILIQHRGEAFQPPTDALPRKPLLPKPATMPTGGRAIPTGARPASTAPRSAAPKAPRIRLLTNSAKASTNAAKLAADPGKPTAGATPVSEPSVQPAGSHPLGIAAKLGMVHKGSRTTSGGTRQHFLMHKHPQAKLRRLAENLHHEGHTITRMHPPRRVTVSGIPALQYTFESKDKNGQKHVFHSVRDF